MSQPKFCRLIMTMISELFKKFYGFSVAGKRVSQARYLSFFSWGVSPLP